jgi:hypothetical protein
VPFSAQACTSFLPCLSLASQEGMGDLANGPAQETTTLVDFARDIRASRSSESATTMSGAFLLEFRGVISSTTAVSLA